MAKTYYIIEDSHIETDSKFSIWSDHYNVQTYDEAVALFNERKASIPSEYATEYETRAAKRTMRNTSYAVELFKCVVPDECEDDLDFGEWEFAEPIDYFEYGLNEYIRELEKLIDERIGTPDE